VGVSVRLRPPALYSFNSLQPIALTRFRSPILPIVAVFASNFSAAALKSDSQMMLYRW